MERSAISDRTWCSASDVHDAHGECKVRTFITANDLKLLGSRNPRLSAYIPETKYFKTKQVRLILLSDVGNSAGVDE